MSDSTPVGVSVAHASLARLVAEGSAAVLALVTGAMVALQLGADAKGVTASLGYVVALIGPLSALGIGEVSVTMVRSGRVGLQEALSAALGLLSVSTIAGGLLLLGVCALQYRHVFWLLNGSIVIGVASVPLLAGWLTLTLLAESQGAMYASSLARITVSVITVLGTFAFVLKLHRGVAGAVAAGGLGYAAGVLLLVVALARRGALPLPRWRPEYLRTVLPIGLPIALASLLMGASARMDLLLVQAILGGGDAGLYSVALTASQLVAYGAVALSTATFPRVADTAGDVDYIERLTRTSLVLTLVPAIGLAAVLPFVVPFAYGDGFRVAVPLTYLLLPAGILFGPQWVLCRAWVAGHRPHVLLASFAASTGTMLTADLVLIPLHGTAGAGWASMLGAVVGLSVAARAHRRLGGHGPVALLLPRVDDLRHLRARTGAGPSSPNG